MFFSLTFVELMKFGGKLFFEWDSEMYDPITNEPAKANTSDINEELGQVRVIKVYIFCNSI